MLDLLIDTWWAGPLLWACVYVSDYYLTLACARLYRAQDKVVFEGSYEITPYFQADVDALRAVSPRFVLALVFNMAVLLFLRGIAGPGSGLVGAYQFVLGGLLLSQATVHKRHLSNWYLFSRGIAAVKGRLEYPRGILLRSSAFELLLFAALYAGIFVMTMSLFVLGGSITCAVLSLKHYRLARRQDRTVGAPALTQA